MKRPVPSLPRAALALLSGLLAVFIAAAQTPAPAAAPHDETRTTYLLGPDDTVTIRAENAPDLSDKPFRVDAAGELKLPMIGRLHAGGLTVDQLETEIATRLKVYIVEPEVTVSITEFRSQPVSVVGAVATPGVHQLEGRKTLVEILAIAGGLRPDAGLASRSPGASNSGASRYPAPRTIPRISTASRKSI